MNKAITTVREFLRKIKQILFPSKELSKQEQLVVDRVFDTLNEKDTVVVTAPGDRYYIINETTGKVIKVSETETVISNGELFLTKSYSLQFQEKLLNIIQNYVCSQVDSIEDRIAELELEQLENKVEE